MTIYHDTKNVEQALSCVCLIPLIAINSINRNWEPLSGRLLSQGKAIQNASLCAAVERFSPSAASSVYRLWWWTGGLTSLLSFFFSFIPLKCRAEMQGESAPSEYRNSVSTFWKNRVCGFPQKFIRLFVSSFFLSAPTFQLRVVAWQSAEAFVSYENTFFPQTTKYFSSHWCLVL